MASLEQFYNRWYREQFCEKAEIRSLIYTVVNPDLTYTYTQRFTARELNRRYFGGSVYINAPEIPSAAFAV